MRTLLGAGLEVDGRPAFVVSLQSIATASRLDMICARDNFQVLRIYGPPLPPEEGQPG